MYAGSGSGFRRDVGAVWSHIRHVIRYDEGGARDCPSGSFHCLPGNFPGYYGGAAGHRQNGDSHVEHVIWRRGESGCSLAADIGSGLPYSGCSLGLESEFCAGGSNQYLFPVSERDPVSGQGQPEDSVGFPVYGTGRENGCSVLYG